MTVYVSCFDVVLRRLHYCLYVCRTFLDSVQECWICKDARKVEIRNPDRAHNKGSQDDRKPHPVSPFAVMIESVHAFVAVAAMAAPFVDVQLAEEAKSLIRCGARRSLTLQRSISRYRSD